MRALGERSQAASVKPGKDRLQRVRAELGKQWAERVGTTGSRRLSGGPLREDGWRVFEIEERKGVGHTTDSAAFIGIDAGALHRVSVLCCGDTHSFLGKAPRKHRALQT